MSRVVDDFTITQPHHLHRQSSSSFSSSHHLQQSRQCKSAFLLPSQQGSSSVTDLFKDEEFSRRHQLRHRLKVKSKGNNRIFLIITSILLLLNLASSQHPCPTCGQFDADMKVEVIKEQILSKLHLKDRPKLKLNPESYLEAVRVVRGETKKRVSSTLKLDDVMLSDGLSSFDHEEGEDEDYYSKTSQIISFPLQVGTTSINGHPLFVFNPPTEIETQFLEVTSAHLWVKLKHIHRNRHRMVRSSSSTDHLHVYLFEVSKNMTMTHVATKKVHSIRPGVKSINIFGFVKEWISRMDNLTVLVDCVGCTHHSLTIDQNSSLPFITINTQVRNDTIGQRNRRNIRSCHPSKTSCCRQSLWVSFEKLGWSDWIIAPRGYWANFCSGGCGSKKTLSDPGTLKTFHAHVMEDYRLLNPYASISPCCAPTKLSSMSLLYFDSENRIVKADLPKMTVDDCGCT